MFDVLPPFMIYLIAALILPFIKAGNLRSGFATLIPLIGAWIIWNAPIGAHAQLVFFGFDLELMRVDKLSRIFALVFSLAAFIGMIYAWHLRDWVQQTSALLYAGSAIGAVFVGDMISLFFFWEGTAIASVFLIWARGTEGAFHTGMRYLLIQIGSGVILIAGVTMHYHASGSIGFDKLTLPMGISSIGDLAIWCIFISFGIKAAFPLLHNWLQDSYPAATVTGSVFLSAFTTKLAIYALARTFPGTELLIYIGAIMALFPMFYAIIENDLRRVLAHCLNNQLGFMVVGVGVGTELALNGTAAHAFAHILYKSLLFMSIGAVLYRTGTSKASQLGGLYRTMPLTLVFCLLGAASTGVPLFSGFVAKSLILSGAAHEHYYVIWGILVFASAGVFFLAGIKIPYFAFFAKDSGKRPKEAPMHMLIAMGLAGFFCVVIGLFPAQFYQLLPYAVDYDAYTTTHVITQMQLLFGAALVFTVMIRTKIYPADMKSVNLDFDVTYRKWLPALFGYLAMVVTAVFHGVTGFINSSTVKIIKALHNSHGPDGSRAASWPSGAMVLNIALLLGFALVVIYVS